MSNTDPDLKPRAGNKPIALDVVDGNLIVKRANGREESFPMGGGGAAGFVSIDDTTNNMDPVFEVTGYEPQVGEKFILCDASAGDVRVYLPLDPVEGQTYTLIKTDGSQNSVSARTGNDYYQDSEPVSDAVFADGQSNVGMNLPYGSFTVVSDGINWFAAGVGLHIIAGTQYESSSGWWDLSLDSNDGFIYPKAQLVRTISTATPTGIATHRERLTLVDATSGNGSFNLLGGTAAGHVGTETTIKKIDATVNTVTLTVPSGKSIDGVVDDTIVLTDEGESVTVIDVGNGNYHTV